MLARFIVIILVLSSIISNCQTTVNDSLLLFEKNYYNSSEKIIQDSILFKKYNFCLKKNLLADAYNTYLRMEKGNVKYFNKNYYWNSALLCVDNNNFNLAKSNLNLYFLNFDSVSVQANFLAFLTYVNYDSIKANYHYKKLKKLDTSLACLNCFYKLLNYKAKGKAFYTTSAVVLPGSGLIFEGKPIKGLTSMVLLSSLSYGIFQLTQYNLYVNAFSWTMGLGLKLYSGQIKLTRKEFDKRFQKRKNKKAEICKNAYRTKMLKYNITYNPH